MGDGNGVPRVGQVTVGLAGGHHHDGCLLSRFGQRCQQRPLPLGMVDSQVLPSPFELVKLQLHTTIPWRRDQYGAGWNWSFSGAGEVGIRCTRNWCFAERNRSDPITPMKSEPFCSISSFARAQGS